jgi:FixJ family two-component response regulator
VASPDSSKLVRTRFLVADRDADESLRWQAELRPYASVVATNVGRARSLWKAGGIVGIVLDATLDGIGALELAEELRAAEDRTPILVLHGMGEPATFNRFQLIRGTSSVFREGAEENVRLFGHEAAEELDDASIRAAVKTWRQRFRLSGAERLALQSAVRNSGYAAMAEDLGVSVRTAESQLQAVLDKTGYSSRERLLIAVVASARR